MSRNQVDPRWKARFRETAREIILRDRQARKSGQSQNTIGEIARALAQAFALGRQLGDGPISGPRPDHLGIDWEEVPLRGRDVLIGLTNRHEQFAMPSVAGLRCVVVGERTRWSFEYENGRVGDYSLASGSVSPLVRAGLLIAPETTAETLVLTPKGRATCEAYWRRRAAQDATLPKESIRA